MSKVKLTCFADEISSELDEQLDILEQEGLKYLELRGVWDKNVLDLNDDELDRIQTLIQKRGFRISSIASPVGKYLITDPFEPQLHDLDKAILVAHYFGTPYIRIFSYRLPENEPVEKHRHEVLHRLKLLTEAASRNHVILILENDSNLYGSTDDRCLEILTHCDSKHMRAAFDSGNYVMNGVQPMNEAYPKISPYLDYVHIKDAIQEPRQFVPAGVGEGCIEELLIELKKSKFDGFLSVEPHLKPYLPEASNPERVITAIRALKVLLEKVDQEWE
ncbi:sugar phosphate isomerase/epimerase family protein [Paenibacillus agricola]|uniref:Sugar phosphate isomerase/epimerase n=1 Tax=Paenibacillus agricola TaxID=2716264 RepID=A0ABX0J778_9BACL|nr:sugar phosphate isomerase/epimerase family protein [Paenibacillus agricola]NHN29891.1 sugar phosphate isomerase/epimerase [Paenibacillus agricola]